MIRPKKKRGTRNSQLVDHVTNTIPDSVENHDDITKEIAQYILSSASSRGCCKELELRKLMEIPINEFHAAVMDANKRLQEVLGCQITSSSGRSYVVNLLNQSEECSQSKDIVEDAKNGLLIVILIFIFMSQNPLNEKASVTDTMLWNFLAGGELGITRDMEASHIGDIDKLIAPSYSADFINKGWIEFHKSVDHLETEQITYSWGARAKVSIDPMKVLEAFCEIIDDHPKHWTDYFERAQQLKREWNSTLDI